MSETVSDIPRWARPLGQETWERINERMHDGWDTADIMRELDIPQTKMRSMQAMAHKYGPRRRLQQFGRFKDALAKGAQSIGPKLIESLQTIAAMAVNPHVKDSTQRQASDLLLRFADEIRKIMRDDQELVLQTEKQDGEKQDVQQMMRRILDIYGVSGG